MALVTDLLILFFLCRGRPKITIIEVVKKDLAIEGVLVIVVFFFLISNVRILLIIEKVPNRVHWGCTMGAQIRKQKYNGQEK